MTEMQRKWNEKYEERLLTESTPQANEKLVELTSYLHHGKALDIACGLGGNSLFLAEKGYQVSAYDLSDVAIDFLQAEGERKNIPLQASVCDLTDYDHLPFQEESFDLVVITNYLDRRLFPIVKKVVKENGYFFMDTFSRNEELKGPTQMPEKYKLQSQELLKEFSQWKLLAFHELDGRQMILCQRTYE